MRSENKILAFRSSSRDCENEINDNRKICKKLEDKFRDEPSESPLREKSNFGSNCNPGMLTKMNFANSRKVIRSGAEKISKTFRRVRTTFGTLSQHFQVGSRRRQRLTETATPAHTPVTPQARCRQVLGRTPTKMYSPFGIETPHYLTDKNESFNPDTPEHGVSPVRKHRRSAAHPWHFISRRPRSLFR